MSSWVSSWISLHYIKWGYPVDSSFACNSMKILIDNLILITMDREHHATSYHRSVWVQRCTFLSSYTAMGKGGNHRAYNVIFLRGDRHVWPHISQLFFHKNVEFTFDTLHSSLNTNFLFFGHPVLRWTLLDDLNPELRPVEASLLGQSLVALHSEYITAWLRPVEASL